MTKPSPKLHTDFPDMQADAWTALVAASLRGASLDDMIRRTDDSLARGPLFTLADRPAHTPSHPRVPSPQTEGRGWHISAPVTDPDIAHANRQALEDLKGGASGLRLTLDPTGQNGVAVHTAADMKRLFEGIYTDLIPLSFAPSIHSPSYVALLAARPALHSAHIHVGLDPISRAFDRQTQPDLQPVQEIVAWAETAAPHWRCVTIDAAHIHEAGGTDAQDLSFMASALTAYMRALVSGRGAEQAAKQIAVTLATDQDGHLGIIKVRAARQICARITEAFGAPDSTIPIHAVTSRRMMQSVDPWTNMLRVMSAGFGAVCGGADYVTTRPFTERLGLATGFGHRIARNMQILMREESHLGRVTDPASGSYFHDHMTAQLAETAWTEFQAIESGGGIGAMTETGVFKQSIAATAERRAALKQPIVGVTLHPGEDLRAAKTRPRPKLRENTAPMIPLMSDGASFKDMITGAEKGHSVGATS